MQVIMLTHGLCPARLYKELGNHRMAASACLRGNDFVGAAESCEQEASRLTGQAAQARLQDAIKHYKKAKQHLLGFQLLQRHPELANSMMPEVLPCPLPLFALMFTHACTVQCNWLYLETPHLQICPPGAVAVLICCLPGCSICLSFLQQQG